MNKWLRTLFIATIWGYVLFYWCINGFLVANWDFSLFRKTDWLYIIDEFEKGWVISSFSDNLFFAILILMLPIYFWVLRYLLSIKWISGAKKAFKKCFFFILPAKKAPVKSIAKKNANSKNTRPKAMESSMAKPVMKQVETKVSVEKPAKNKPTPAPTMAPTMPTDRPAFEKTPQSEKSAFDFDEEQAFDFEKFKQEMAAYSVPKESPFNQGFSGESALEKSPVFSQSFNNTDDMGEDFDIPREPVIEDIAQIFKQAGYHLIEKSVINGEIIDYIAVAENKIYIAKIDDEAGDWLADEERFNNEDPLWFSESAHRISPIFTLTESVKRISTQIENTGFTGQIIPLLIEKTGVIINADDMQQSWDKMGIVVARTDMGGPDELNTVSNTISPTNPATPDIITAITQAIGV